MFRGQMIGGIVAHTALEARRAVQKVKVNYEELPAVLSLKVSFSIVRCGCNHSHTVTATLILDIRVKARVIFEIFNIVCNNQPNVLLVSAVITMM
jgi:xanthine dehydrogenase molybdopterin-binding subunit B